MEFERYVIYFCNGIGMDVDHPAPSACIYVPGFVATYDGPLTPHRLAELMGVACEYLRHAPGGSHVYYKTISCSLPGSDKAVLNMWTYPLDPVVVRKTAWPSQYLLFGDIRTLERKMLSIYYGFMLTALRDDPKSMSLLALSPRYFPSNVHSPTLMLATEFDVTEWTSIL